MNENEFGSSLPEEIDYTPQSPKNNGPVGVTAPVLDDIDYAAAPSSKKDGPTGVSAPILDDMDNYVPPTAKKGAPTGVSAPVLDDNSAYSATAASAPEPEQLVLSDEDIIAGLTPELLDTFNKLPPENQQKVLDMRRAQLGAVAPPPKITAPVLDEDNYTPPPKKEEPPKPEAPVTAPVLDEEPEAPKYVPKYVDEDLEAAKRDAKKSVSSSLTSNPKDQKESLRMALELKEQLRQQEAEKGFKLSVLVAAIGVISAVAFYLLYSGQLGLSYKDGLSGAGKFISNISLYIAIAAGASAAFLPTGISAAHSLASFVFLIAGVVQIFPGSVMIPQHNGSMGLVVLLYAVALIGTIAVFVLLSASECIGQFFKKSKN